MTERESRLERGKIVARKVAETTVDILVALSRPGNSLIPPLQPWERLPAKGAGSDADQIKMEPRAQNSNETQNEIAVFERPSK